MSSLHTESEESLGRGRGSSRIGHMRNLRTLNTRTAVVLTGVLLILIAQGAAIAHSDLWAAPLVGLLLIGVATTIPLVPFVGGALLVRALTDDVAASGARHSGSLDLSGLIAGAFIVLAIGLVLRRRQGLRTAFAVTLWLAAWTAIAVKTNGASSITVREGVREGSIFALGLIAFNSRGILTCAVVTRLIQIAGIISALIALYQLASHTGTDVSGEIRSNGTFAHPNDAAVYFAVASVASAWRYVDCGRAKRDAVAGALFIAATIATFSLGGVACLLVMIVAFGVLRSRSLRLQVGSCVVAALIAIVFLATPVGAERISSESTTELAATGEHGAAKTSLEWRLDKWQKLINVWQRQPVLGRGLGTITSEEAPAEHPDNSPLPHNEYLRYLVETGALGVAILFGAGVILVRRLNDAARAFGDRHGATLARAVIVGLAINALASNTLLYTPAAYAAALIVACALSPPIGLAGSGGRQGRGSELRSVS